MIVDGMLGLVSMTLILLSINDDSGILSLSLYLSIYLSLYILKLAANFIESLLLNGICVNLIGIHCFWSYVQLRNEVLLISLTHYVTKLNGQTQSVLSRDH